METNKRSKLRLFFTLCLSLSIIASNSVSSLAATIGITLPTFDVTINGIKIQNEYRAYPFIVYKDITYVPMTYVDSRFLGLETKWDNSTGLEVINRANIPSYGGFEPDIQDRKNSNRYSVSLPTFRITVNSKLIDNSKETYPLLIFRDITYFPLTWRFAVEEFGWDYSFSHETGLKINSFTPPPESPTYPLVSEKIFDDIKVRILYHRIPSPGNLYISLDEEEYMPLGDPNLIYGVVGSKGIGESGLFIQSDCYMELRNGWLYINALDCRKDGVSGIYKVNIKTGETSVTE